MNLQDEVNDLFTKPQNNLEQQATTHSQMMQAGGWQESPGEDVNPTLQVQSQPEYDPENKPQYDPKQETVYENPAPVAQAAPEVDEREQLRAENEAQRRENLKNMRLINERLEWERNEALRQLETERASRQKASEVDIDDSGIEEDDITSKKHVKKIVNQSLNRTTKNLEQKISQLENQIVESKLEAKLPNFREIVTDANLKKLAERYPHHVRNLSYSPNYEDRAMAAYELIVDKGIDKEEGVSNMARQKIANNMARPKPAATVNPNASNSTLSKQNAYSDELTQERKNQIWREMQEIKKRNPLF